MLLKTKIVKNLPINEIKNHYKTTTFEPSLCWFGKTILYTCNFYAFKSINDGKTWIKLDPEKIPYPPAGMKFDCDQTVIYDPSRKLTFWILQYVNAFDSKGENVLRVAVNKSPTLKDSEWYWWDLAPKLRPAWKNLWFDYNHAALSNNCLYVGTNVYDRDDIYSRSLVFRLSLDKLADPEANIDFDVLTSHSQVGTLRCVAGAQNTMYIGSLYEPADRPPDQIKIYIWPENKEKASARTVKFTPFSYTTQFRAKCPDGNNWVKRLDERLLSGWYSNGVLGFLWNVGKQPDKPYPSIRCIRINAKKMKLIDEPDIYSNKTAFAWPDACANNNGNVGITFFQGGIEKFPEFVIGYWDETLTDWRFASIFKSTHGPYDDSLGDYITCRPYWPGGKKWVAAGFVLDGGSRERNIKPVIVRFHI